MHGAGTLRYPDGSKFQGSFKNGEKHGKGKESNPKDGSKFEGFW